MRPAIALANQLIRIARAERVALSGAQLQALLYLAHGQRFATLNKALLDEPPLAHADGVMLAGLNRAGALGTRPVRAMLAQIVPGGEGETLRERFVALKPEDPVCALLTETWQRYGRLPLYELNRLVRIPGGPWDQVWNDPSRRDGGGETAASGLASPDHGEARAAVIPAPLIRRWFRRQMIEQQRARADAEGLAETLSLDGSALEATLHAGPDPELRSV